mgnify:FL=1
MAERIRTLGLEVAVLGPPGFVPFLYKDRDYWGDIARKSGARID